jgi:hypothetical protein
MLALGKRSTFLAEKKFDENFTWIVATSVYSKKMFAAVDKKFSASTGSA